MSYGTLVKNHRKQLPTDDIQYMQTFFQRMYRVTETLQFALTKLPVLFFLREKIFFKTKITCTTEIF
jgi:hypothetical protein